MGRARAGGKTREGREGEPRAGKLGRDGEKPCVGKRREGGEGDCGPGCQGEKEGRERRGNGRLGWAPKERKEGGGKKKEEEQMLLNLNMKIEFKFKSK
jgi:hypothetical protein